VCLESHSCLEMEPARVPVVSQKSQGGSPEDQPQPLKRMKKVRLALSKQYVKGCVEIRQTPCLDDQRLSGT
jgi:hypothetical protein